MRVSAGRFATFVVGIEVVRRRGQIEVEGGRLEDQEAYQVSSFLEAVGKGVVAVRLVLASSPVGEGKEALACRETVDHQEAWRCERTINKK